MELKYSFITNMFYTYKYDQDNILKESLTFTPSSNLHYCLINYNKDGSMSKKHTMTGKRVMIAFYNDLKGYTEGYSYNLDLDSVRSEIIAYKGLNRFSVANIKDRYGKRSIDVKFGLDKKTIEIWQRKESQ